MVNAIDYIYGWCWKHEELVGDAMGDYKKYRCLDCEYLESTDDQNVECFSIEEYAVERNLSMWKVRQMIKNGEVDARLMDKTAAPDPRTRSSSPLKKWLIIVRKTRAATP